MGILCCAQLSLVIGAFERALRLDEIAAIGVRMRKVQKGQLADTDNRGLVLTNKRTGENGYLEFLVRDQPHQEKITITLPEGISCGDKLRLTAAGGAFFVVLPSGVIAGQSLSVEIPGQKASTTQWQPLEALETADNMYKVMEFELIQERKLRREERDKEEVKSVLNTLIHSLERAEQSELIKCQRVHQERARLEHEQATDMRDQRIPAKKRRRETEEQISLYPLQTAPCSNPQPHLHTPPLKYQQFPAQQQDQFSIPYVMATPFDYSEQHRRQQWQPQQHQFLQQQFLQQQQQQLHQVQHLQHHVQQLHQLHAHAPMQQLRQVHLLSQPQKMHVQQQQALIQQTQVHQEEQEQMQLKHQAHERRQHILQQEHLLLHQQTQQHRLQHGNQIQVAPVEQQHLNYVGSSPRQAALNRGVRIQYEQFLGDFGNKGATDFGVK